MEYRSPLAMLYHWEKNTPDRVYMKQPVNSAWRTWTWRETAKEVRQLAAAIQALSLPANSHIAILSKNYPYWIICDLAVMMSGHVSVPLYPNLQKETVEQTLKQSESVLLFVGKLDNWDELRDAVPRQIRCVSLPSCDHDHCESWTNFTGAYSPVEQDVDRPESDLCSIVYTSGTGGSPKGAMFTFHAFAFVGQHAVAPLKFNSTDRFFSYLPLSHIAERMLVEMMSLYVGGQVSFAESLQTFPKDLAESNPTVFLGVHRIWTKFQQSVLAKLPQKNLDTLLGIPVLASFTKRKIRKALGLNQARMVLTGAGPTPPDLINWFSRLGIKIQEAYAMTENCCYSHVTLKKKIKIGYVGQQLPNCEVRLGEDNEIQVKHTGLMKGYFKEPEKSLEAFTVEGFLRTGDEGFIDGEGFLKITGRLKDLFKTAKGKYVAPSPIEMKFSSNADVEQICVVGTGLAQPMALLTLSLAGKRKNTDELILEFKNALRNINDLLDPHEKLSKIIILKDEWLVENNLLTPSLKIKRNEIERRYAGSYEEWDQLRGPVQLIKEKQAERVQLV